MSDTEDKYITIEGKPRENSKIKKGNLLVNASYWMTVREKKLMWWIIWGYQKHQSKKLTVKLNDFHKWGSESKNNNEYEESWEAAKRLRARDIGIEKPDEDRLGVCGFLSYVEHGKKRSGELDVEITSQIVPYIESYVKESKFGFTRYEMSVIGALRTFRGHRMYELSKSLNFGNRSKQGVRFSFDEVRARFGCLTYDKKGKVTRNEYPEWKRFKSKVLDPAIDEVEELTDLTVRYVLEKSGRSVVGLRVFVIQGVNQEIASYKDVRSQYLAIEMGKLGVLKSKAEALLELYGDGDEVVLELALNETQRQMKKGVVGNPAGLFIKLVKVDLRNQAQEKEAKVLDRREAAEDVKKRGESGRKSNKKFNSLRDLLQKDS